MNVSRPANNIEKIAFEDGTLYVHQTYYDDASLERNKQIRNSAIMDKLKLGLHENEDVRMAISCPSLMQWNRFKKLHPETYALLMSNREEERVRGARQLQILEPAWVVQSRL